MYFGHCPVAFRVEKCVFFSISGTLWLLLAREKHDYVAYFLKSCTFSVLFEIFHLFPPPVGDYFSPFSSIKYFYHLYADSLVFCITEQWIHLEEHSLYSLVVSLSMTFFLYCCVGPPNQSWLQLACEILSPLHFLVIFLSPTLISVTFGSFL